MVVVVACVLVILFLFFEKGISNFVTLSSILAPIYLKLVLTFRCGTMFTLLVPDLCFFWTDRFILL
jgi:hypothetical protein